MEASENPEEITVETNSYTEDWDLTKSDMGSDIVWDSGHQRWSVVAVKSALNRCWKEMSMKEKVKRETRQQPVKSTHGCNFSFHRSGRRRGVAVTTYKWAECFFTGLLQCVNALGQKSHRSPGPKRSNGGFTRLINNP